VLGTALDGAVPGRAFAARLERARALAEADPSLRIAVLGGGTPSEAEAGAAWLHAAGIAPGRILAETRSRHTLENLRAFRDAVPAHGAALLVTSRSHLARAAAMADGFGLLVQPVAAADPAGLRRLPVEAFLLHWYLVGRAFARATRNRRMLARIA
jgi:uncharacterized SAM-binding protein YcdF (DUF218 family)